MLISTSILADILSDYHAYASTPPSINPSIHPIACMSGAIDQGRCTTVIKWGNNEHLKTIPFLAAVCRSQGGSTNHVFGYHVGKMTKKGCPKTRPEKTSKFDRKIVPKWEGLGGENERFAGDLLQNKGFRGIVKYWENWCQKWSKKRPKSEPKSDFWHF